MNLRSLDDYHRAWWDWSWLNDCFRGGIRVADVDGIVERRGRFLLLEGKRIVSTQPLPLPRGQQLLHDALCATGCFTVLVFWGVPPRGPVLFHRLQSRHGIGKTSRSSKEQVANIVRRWYAWADSGKTSAPTV